MGKRGWEHRKHLYLIWTFISVILLYLVVQYSLEGYLLLIVFILFLKDIFVDLGCFGLFGKKLPKKGPYPDKLEHAPFVVLIATGGLLGYLDVSSLTISISVVDAIIDVLDDMGKI